MKEKSEFNGGIWDIEKCDKNKMSIMHVFVKLSVAMSNSSQHLIKGDELMMNRYKTEAHLTIGTYETNHSVQENT